MTNSETIRAAKIIIPLLSIALFAFGFIGFSLVSESLFCNALLASAPSLTYFFLARWNLKNIELKIEFEDLKDQWALEDAAFAAKAKREEIELWNEVYTINCGVK